MLCSGMWKVYALYRSPSTKSKINVYVSITEMRTQTNIHIKHVTQLEPETKFLILIIIILKSYSFITGLRQIQVRLWFSGEKKHFLKETYSLSEYAVKSEDVCPLSHISTVQRILQFLL